MGGNALKNVKTRRYQREEYLQLKQRILNTIQEHVKQVDVPKEFPNKESFGDLDVMIVSPENVSCKQLIIDLFQPIEIVENGDVFSFDVDEFQIDFILVPETYFRNATVYFSYSDLGGLIGNICHKIGLKYGIQGLWLNIHTKEFDPTTTSTKLILSEDPEEIFRFLGHDYQRYLRGFNNENELFQWIIEGKYFRRFYFHEDHLNHAHRHRTSKRPIYMKFIEFLNQNLSSNEENDSLNEVEEKELAKKVRHAALIDFNKYDQYQANLQMTDQKRIYRAKYSGKYFIDVVEVRSDIPSVMKNFERLIAETDEEFQRWVLENDQETIEKQINNFKQQFKSNRHDLVSKKSED